MSGRDVPERTATLCPLWRWRPYQKADSSRIAGEQPAQFRRGPASMGVDSDENELDGAEPDFEGYSAP